MRVQVVGVFEDSEHTDVICRFVCQMDDRENFTLIEGAADGYLLSPDQLEWWKTHRGAEIYDEARANYRAVHKTVLATKAEAQ